MSAVLWKNLWLQTCADMAHAGKIIVFQSKDGAPDKSIYGMRYNRFRESLAKVKAFLDTEVWKRQPKYLGDVIPIMGDGIATED